MVGLIEVRDHRIKFNSKQSKHLNMVNQYKLGIKILVRLKDQAKKKQKKLA